MTVKQFTEMIDLEGLDSRPKIVLAVDDDREVITNDYNMYDRFQVAAYGNWKIASVAAIDTNHYEINIATTPRQPIIE